MVWIGDAGRLRAVSGSSRELSQARRIGYPHADYRPDHHPTMRIGGITTRADGTIDSPDMEGERKDGGRSKKDSCASGAAALTVSVTTSGSREAKPGARDWSRFPPMSGGSTAASCAEGRSQAAKRKPAATCRAALRSGPFFLPTRPVRRGKGAEPGRDYWSSSASLNGSSASRPFSALMAKSAFFPSLTALTSNQRPSREIRMFE